MCSSPYWQVGWSWFRKKIVSCEPGTKAIAVSSFRKKLSPTNWVQGVTAISWKIPRSWVPKKWGPTCNRHISNSTIYMTAIYREYTLPNHNKTQQSMNQVDISWNLLCIKQLSANRSTKNIIKYHMVPIHILITDFCFTIKQNVTVSSHIVAHN